MCRGMRVPLVLPRPRGAPGPLAKWRRSQRCPCPPKLQDVPTGTARHPVPAVACWAKLGPPKPAPGTLFGAFLQVPLAHSTHLEPPWPAPTLVLPVLGHTQLTLFFMNDRAEQQDLATTQIPIFHPLWLLTPSVKALGWFLLAAGFQTPRTSRSHDCSSAWFLFCCKKSSWRFSHSVLGSFYWFETRCTSCMGGTAGLAQPLQALKTLVLET